MAPARRTSASSSAAAPVHRARGGAGPDARAEGRTAATRALDAGAVPGDVPGVAPGDDAEAPRHLPPGAWGPALRRAGRRLLVERFPLLSAGIAFFAVLAIAPVLVTALSVYAAVNTPRQALEQLSGVARMLPPQLRGVAVDQVTSITAASTEVLTVRGTIALVVALWTATTAMTYLLDALTLAYREEESRSFLRRTGRALLFVLGTSVLLGAALTVAGLLSDDVGAAPAVVQTLVRVLVWLLVAAVMVTGLSTLYRFAPDRTRPRWTWTSWGATGAAAVWLAATIAFFLYVQRLGTYTATYGSLAGVVISMVWSWLTVLLVLAGALVNAEAERQTARDSTVGPERPVGARGAVVADDAPPHED